MDIKTLNEQIKDLKRDLNNELNKSCKSCIKMKESKILHYFFKGMIVAGVFSIVLIEINPLTLQTIAQNFNQRIN